MKAEFIEFNGDWHKDCPKCKTPYGARSLDGLSAFFTKSKNRIDGLDNICKQCRKLYRKQNSVKELARWKMYYKPGSENRKRHVVRSQTRRKHGKASKFICTKCKSAQAVEWHHIIYETNGAVPLCHPCHEKV